MWPASDDCWREGWVRYAPSLDRLPLEQCETAISVLFRLFRVFRRK